MNILSTRLTAPGFPRMNSDIRHLKFTVTKKRTHNLWFGRPLSSPLDHASNRCKGGSISHYYYSIGSRLPTTKILIYSYMCTELRSKTLISNWPHAQMKQYFIRNYSVDTLKTSSKGKKSNTTLFISDDFYNQAKLWPGQEGSFESISKKDIATCNKRKQ